MYCWKSSHVHNTELQRYQFKSFSVSILESCIMIIQLAVAILYTSAMMQSKILHSAADIPYPVFILYESISRAVHSHQFGPILFSARLLHLWNDCDTAIPVMFSSIFPGLRLGPTSLHVPNKSHATLQRLTGRPHLTGLRLR
jgi:hypothetical protein